MKFATYIFNGQSKVGLLDEQNDVIIDLVNAQKTIIEKSSIPMSMVECLQQGEGFIDDVIKLVHILTEDTKQQFSHSLDEVKILAPIPRPSKNIFCVGKNYREHAIEMGSEADIPQYPMLFSKLPTTVIATEEAILHHQDVTRELDYEGELAVIIGKEGKNIALENAMEYVFGYTIVNDISARDRQKRHKQFLLGKSLDTSCPMGPYITHKSAVENPHLLMLETKVNGEVRQHSNTEKLIFDIPTLVSTISEGTTLEPGDIIATGTPDGVGKGFKPPRFLQPGDSIEITIEGLGTLRNKIQN